MRRNNKEKILIISRKYPPSTGGMQTYSRCLVGSLSKRYSVATVVLGKSQVHLIWFLPYAALVSAVKVLFAGYRLVYLCDGLLAPLGLLLKVIFRVKVIATVHGLDITYRNSFYQAVVPRCIAGLDRIVCVSRNTLKICVEKGVKEDKCVFIPNGIEGTAMNIPGNISSGSLNSLYDLMGGNTCGKKILLTVGRLVERKGVEPFIDNVFVRLADDFVYFVAGDGPLRQWIEELLSVKKIQGVYLLGRVDAAVLEALYENAYAFIMPNIKVEDDPEGFGIVSLEAAYRGVPVIAYDVDGISDAVLEGETGWLIKPGDTEAFIEKIKEPLLIKDDIIASSRKYEWGSLIHKYEIQINGLLDKRTDNTAKKNEQDTTFPEAKVFTVTMTPINPPFDDGPKNMVYCIAKTLKKVKFYFISSLSRDDFEKHDNMVFIHSPFQNKRHHSMPFIQRIYVFMAMLINLPGIDVFQFFFTPNRLFSFVCGKLLKITGKKSIQVVSSVHTLLSMLDKDDMSSVLNSDIIVTQSEYARDLLKQKGVHNVKAVYPGIDPERFDPERYDRIYDGLDPEFEYVLYPGNYGLLQQAFSFEEFLSIVKTICAKDKKVIFIMACRIRTDRDAMLEETFKKLAKEYNVEDKMIYKNTVENMPFLMSSCSAGILPARKNMIKILEIPLVIMEMCALGKPFIYGNVRPLEELKEKEVGDCPENNTKEEYIELIFRSVKRSKTERCNAALRRAVLKTFTVEKQAGEFEKMYCRLMQGEKCQIT